MASRPDIVILLTDEERASPPYESGALREWREDTLAGQRWFTEHAVSFERHYVGSLACVPSRSTLFTGQYPDVHGVTQTDGLGKMAGDPGMRWLPPGEVPTLGHWFRAAGYDTHYDGKWHLSHADLVDPATGEPLATNTAEGAVIPSAVRAYLDADPLAPFGFSGWVGPEPHGPARSNCGVRRDPLTAQRVVAWLRDRYARRRAGDLAALRPFLLVASFVNPHDIVLFPVWRWRSPLGPSRLDPPPVPEAPTRHEDLRTKPAAQTAWREAYYSGYGLSPFVSRIYGRSEQHYRDLYYRLHAEVDGPLDRVRRAVTEEGSENAVLVRSSDHGDLLGAHGGLHQKWFNLYDEATRVPFSIARIGASPTSPRRVSRAPTSHLDLVPTLLAAAGLDEAILAEQLRTSFSEVHALPGRDLMPLVEADAKESERRAVYLMTRDDVLDGETGASRIARALRLTQRVPRGLRIRAPEHVGACFEALVVRVSDEDAPGGAGHLWKLVRTSDEHGRRLELEARQRDAHGAAGSRPRGPLADEWELYDLDADPIEAVNRWRDPAAADVLAHLRDRLARERASLVPERNAPWRTTLGSEARKP